MPSTLDPTVSGAASNTYVTLAEANTYFDDRPHSGVWTGAIDDNKIRALLLAARIIDQSIEWDPERVGSPRSVIGQARFFPRVGTQKFEGDETFEDDELPPFSQDGQCEAALGFLASDRMADVGARGIESVGVGKGAVAVKFDDDASVRRIIVDALWDVAGWWIARKPPAANSLQNADLVRV